MKNRIIRLSILCSILLSVFLSLSNTVYGTNYYVATTGSDSNTGTSVVTPFLTLTYALGKVVAGDTIYMRGGTYAVSSTIKISKIGTSTSRYYLFVYPGDERPILDFSAMVIGNSNRGVSLSGSYWYIKGIRIKGAGDNGLNTSGAYNTIEYCDFFENRDGGCQLGGGAHDNRIINCDSYYNADYVSGSTNYTGGNADGFSPKLDVGTNNYFYGCRSWLNSDDGWDGFLSSDLDVTTTIENCWTWKNGYLKDGTTTTSSMNGNGFKMGGNYFRHNVVLKNCLSFSNKAKGYDQNHDKGSMTLYNCTGKSNGSNNFSISGDQLATGKVLTVKNCISYEKSKVSLLSSAVVATNSWDNQFTVSSADFTSIDTTGISGLRKADGSLPDISFMHLANGSALIDAGTDVGLPYSGTKPDLGCFETANSAVQYTLITSVASGNGTVSPSGSTKLYSSNSISISATPATGYAFDKWTDGNGATLSTSNPYTVSMSGGDLTVKANFISLPQYTLTIVLASGNGTFTPTSGSQYYAGTSVTLTAIPSTGYAFDKWIDVNGTTLSTSNPYTFAMGSADLTVKVNFTSLPQYTLTTGITSGSGTISPASGTLYYSGTSVSITATPDVNYTFVSWGGDASGTTSTTSVTMDANKNVTASFALVKRTLTLTVSPTSSGTITPASSTTYDHGSRVKLTATPATGYLFDKWTNNAGTSLSTYDTLTITMDTDKTITGNFKLNTGVNPVINNSADNSVEVRRNTSGEIRIVFNLEASSRVSVYLYNMQGALVNCIPVKKYPSGSQQIDLVSTSLAPGIYLCKLMVNDNATTRKIMIY